MKKNVLILGTSGMLGSMVLRYLSRNSDFSIAETTSHKATGQNQFLIDDMFRKNILSITNQFKPHYVVNCIGFIRPNNTYTDYKKAILINSVFPKYLSELCLNNGIRLIHVSTDCVFSGKKGNYSDTDIPDETNIYGISKYLGEFCKPPNMIIRTSIVGRELKTHKNLLEWFLRCNDDYVYGYDKVMWNGVTTLTLSKIIHRIIKKDLLFNKPLIQIASKPISKYNLLRVFSKIYNKKVLVKKITTSRSDKTLIPSEEQNLYFKDIIKTLELQIKELKKFYE